MHLDAYLLGGSATAAGWAEAFVCIQSIMLGNELQVLQHILKGTAFVVNLDTPAVIRFAPCMHTQLACRTCYCSTIETGSCSWYVHGTDLHELRYLFPDLWVKHSADRRN